MGGLDGRLNSSGYSTAPVERIYQLDEPLLGIPADVRELNAHTWKQDIPLGFWASPCNLRFGLVFLRGSVGQGKLHSHLGARGQRRAAFNKQTPAPNSTGKAVKPSPFRRRAMNFDRQRRARVGPAVSEPGIFVDGQNVLDQAAPAQCSKRLALVIEKGQCFVVAVNVQRFSLMFLG